MNKIQEQPEDLLGYSVVIVEYFSRDHLFACIDSIERQSQKADKIVVVLNGFEQDTQDRLQNKYENVILINPHVNLGYAKAANLGIANTESAVVLTMNPDAYLDKFAAAFACRYISENDDVGTVGPKIYETNGEVYPSARIEPSLGVAVGHALLGQFFPKNRFTKKYKNTQVDSDQTLEVDWLSGAAIFLRREALNDVGGWDEDYFMYCEDIDLGRNMRIYRWKNVYLPECHVTHAQGISTDRAPISLIIEHHKSLFIFASKKYKKNLLVKVLVGIFIGIRLPLALIAHLFRIN